jgi:hypothetical protein
VWGALSYVLGKLRSESALIIILKIFEISCLVSRVFKTFVKVIPLTQAVKSHKRVRHRWW